MIKLFMNVEDVLKYIGTYGSWSNKLKQMIWHLNKLTPEV